MFKQVLKESVMIRCMVCFLSLLVVKTGLLAGQTGQTEDAILSYEVQVNAQIVPIFAVDSKGNPVQDLKEEDIILYVNRKPYKIVQFMNYQLEEEKEEVEKKKGKTKQEPAAPVTKEGEKIGEGKRKLKIKALERMNFIILDGISNSMSGVRNARKLAIGIVKATPELGENFRIKIKCKRKGVKINTLGYGEKPRPYAEMKEPLKKLFALNVVLGGSWSRMVGKVQRVVCRKIGETPKKKITIKKIDVNIIKALQNRNLDIFVLNVHPVTLKAAIDLFQRKVGEKETIEVEAQTGRKQFVVIVEPEKSHCIFTQVS